MELGIETNIKFMYKIGIIDTMDSKGIKLLDNNKNFSYEIITDLSNKNLLAKLPKFDGVTLRRGKLDEEILKNCKKLKVIARHGVGYDNVDTSYIKKNNISLLVTHNSTSTSPAEHAMFMIINIYKGREMFDSMVREGNFHKAIHLKINDNFELFNKNVLIAGFGRIGKKLIKKCLGFDMNVSVYDPYVDKETIQSLGGKKVSDFDQALMETDILSLSLPLNKKTKNFISLKEMSIMKKSAVLINISRGGIVNEKDLNRALEDKLISFAGIDVFEKEPPDLDNPLLKNNRVLLSPHAATFTRECLENMSIETVQNIIDFFENKIDPIKIIQL
jgi:D-3-phosphoglycerate dehydrogenase / 2-oxoglutarate reductase